MATVTPIDPRSRAMIRALGLETDPETPQQPMTCSMTLMVRRLEMLIGSDRWTLQKVRSGDYEVRTWAPETPKALQRKHGAVGRGHTPTDALANLVGQLGEVTHAATA